MYVQLNVCILRWGVPELIRVVNSYSESSKCSLNINCKP